MSDYTPGTWRYFKNVDETFSVIPADALTDESYAETVIAEVFTDGIADPEANARLMASAPEMKIALIEDVELLRAFEVFMRDSGYDTKDLSEAIRIRDELLGRIDGSNENAPLELS